jgi:hypothetical protein
MQRITKRASRYVWEADGRLYRLSADKAHRVRVPKPTERPELIAAIHDMGHLGFAKTYSVVRRRFWWERMRQDVAEYVRNCEKCAGGQQKLLRNAPLRPLPIVPLWQRVHVDCMGPYPETSEGNRYCVLAVDSWSKYPEIAAIPDKQSATIATWFWRTWVCRYGTPDMVFTDRGGEFEGEFDALLRRQRIAHLRTAGYRPQANGQAERLVGAFLDSLRKVVNDNADDWDTRIHQVAYAYRAAPQASTRVSPALCLFGRELSLAAERPPPSVHPPEGAPEQTEGPTEELRHELLEARRQQLERLEARVDKNLVAAKERNERDYNRRQLKSTPRQRPGATPAGTAPDPKVRTEARPPVEASAGAGPSRPLGPAEQAPPDRQVLNRGAGPSQPARLPPQTTVEPSAAAGPSSVPSGPSKGVAVPLRIQEVADSALPHVPDIPEGTLVFMKRERKSKLGASREGPYFFVCWRAPRGSHAIVRDAAQQVFCIPSHRLYVPANLA